VDFVLWAPVDFVLWALFLARGSTINYKVVLTSRRQVCVPTFLICYQVLQGAIIRVLTYRRYASITFWYFCFQPSTTEVRGILTAYLHFAGTTWPFQAQGSQYPPPPLGQTIDWGKSFIGAKELHEIATLIENYMTNKLTCFFPQNEIILFEIVVFIKSLYYFLAVWHGLVIYFGSLLFFDEGILGDKVTSWLSDLIYGGFFPLTIVFLFNFSRHLETGRLVNLLILSSLLFVILRLVACFLDFILVLYYTAL
jgi:hypothetical protein